MKTKDREEIRPKLTPAEHHKRFVETAKKVEASDKIEDFERAFSDIVLKRPKLKD